jgi:hypothetical protein
MWAFPFVIAVPLALGAIASAGSASFDVAPGWPGKVIVPMVIGYMLLKAYLWRSRPKGRAS